eukprot:TRINITY_DN2785_c0_g1_i3.p1 TRINITY_DN2785_c0_g1~~TRINITY_DN2785_c0_g1_i3.p1  ORF type:complete len:680 (-),score=137.30 TRINITY_DN2785_c0_g1_i3:10-2049(-)
MYKKWCWLLLLLTQVSGKDCLDYSDQILPASCDRINDDFGIETVEKLELLENSNVSHVNGKLEIGTLNGFNRSGYILPLLVIVNELNIYDIDGIYGSIIFPNLTTIESVLSINNINYFDSVKFPMLKTVGGIDISIASISNILDFSSVETVNGRINIHNCSATFMDFGSLWLIGNNSDERNTILHTANLENLNLGNLTTVNGDLHLGPMESTNVSVNITNLESVSGSFIIENVLLEELYQNKLLHVGRDIIIRNNDMLSVLQVRLLRSVDGNFIVSGNPNLQELVASDLEVVGKTMNINVESLNDIQFRMLERVGNLTVEIHDIAINHLYFKKLNTVTGNINVCSGENCCRDFSKVFHMDNTCQLISAYFSCNNYNGTVCLECEGGYKIVHGRCIPLSETHTLLSNSESESLTTENPSSNTEISVSQTMLSALSDTSIGDDITTTSKEEEKDDDEIVVENNNVENNGVNDTYNSVTVESGSLVFSDSDVIVVDDVNLIGSNLKLNNTKFFINSDLVADENSSILIDDGSVLNISGCVIGELKVEVTVTKLEVGKTNLMHFNCRSSNNWDISINRINNDECLTDDIEQTDQDLSLIVRNICGSSINVLYIIVPIVLGVIMIVVGILLAVYNERLKNMMMGNLNIQSNGIAETKLMELQKEIEDVKSSVNNTVTILNDLEK